MHPGLGELLPDAFERSHLPGGNTVVVTQQADWIVGRRADHRDFGYRGFQWQETTLILQQHDGFALRLPRQLAMGSGVVFGIRNLRVRHAFRRIEHTQPEARFEKPLRRSCDLRFGDWPAFTSLRGCVLAAASQIRSRFDGRHRRRALGGHIFVTAKNIADRAAIAHYDSP